MSRPDEQLTQAETAPALTATTAHAAPAPGTKIGRYVVERHLGAGGMGIVVVARHAELGEPVAIKLLHPHAAQDRVQVERFVREARATARIKSEHVVRVLDAGADETTGAPYLVMEHLVGNDLGRVLTEHGRIPAPHAVSYIMQVCEAVAEAHALGIIHRDLKPSNCFLTYRNDGSPLVKVLDFGISKAVNNEGMLDPKLTETQAVFGSPTYMSPEQIRSAKHVDARTDVWSLGVTLFELITGKLPFMADNMSGLLASIVADPPFAVRSFVPEVPEGLERVIFGCLEKNPANRIPTVADLAARLHPYASPGTAMPRIRPSMLPQPAAPAPGQSWPSAPAPIVFGTTGQSLRDTGPAATRRGLRGSLVALIVGAVALLLATSVASVAYLAKSRNSHAQGTSSAPPPEGPSVSSAHVELPPAVSVVTPVKPVDEPTPPASAGPAPSVPASSTRAGKPVVPAVPAGGPTARSGPAHPPVPASGTARTPSAPSGTPPPVSPNLDTRY
ncbi:serine/threonine protein kinase [Labilithrix luteola]|uniref:Serine/threonine protein kinase n=1 Tax=Labilithrix luteola TaxID=1391654 RepID=A0A0K1Q7V7_9BACT|nr:serine/threonine-protein kinase [Labilithrix luteola]AKV01809.1 serine/threonine protein kinase [Labilithrix luteola]